MFDKAIEQLLLGMRVVITPKGNSMTPKIKSGEKFFYIPFGVLPKGEILFW